MLVAWRQGPRELTIKAAPPQMGCCALLLNLGSDGNWLGEEERTADTRAPLYPE